MKLVATVAGGRLYTSVPQLGLVYTPAANATGIGVASFTFQVQDDGGTANGGVDRDPTPNTITFNVTAVTPAGITVSWINPNGGDWNDPGNWDGGVLPGSNDEVIIDMLGTFTVSHSTGATTVKSLTTNHPIDVTGGTLTVTGTLHLTNTAVPLNGGTLAQATVDSLVVNAPDGTPLGIVGPSGASGTLDGVKMVGAQFASSAIVVGTNATLTIRNGLVLRGTMSISGSVLVEGAQAITGLTDAPRGFIQMEAGSVLAAATPGEILTLGFGLIINGTGTIGSASTEVVNSGEIHGSMTLFNLTNLGLLDSDPSSTTVVNGFLVNGGSVVLSNGNVVQVTGDFTNLANGAVIASFNGFGQIGTLAISGTATLDGTLSIFGDDPFFNPTVGNRYRVMWFASRVGFFTTTNQFGFASGLSVTVDQSDPTGLDIVVN